jgi:hypothetical protein
MKSRGCVRRVVIPVDSGPVGGYPTANGSCLHSVASIPASPVSMQKFLCASRLRLLVPARFPAEANTQQ